MLKVILAVIIVLLLVVMGLLFVASHFWHKIQNVGQDNKETTLKDGSKLRRMAVLSETLHHLYLSKQAPTMHGVIYGIDPHKKDITKFWEELCQHWPNFRSIPLKHNDIWYWKELELSKMDMSKHVTQIELNLEEESKSDKSSGAVDHHLGQIVKFLNSKDLARPFDKDRPHWEYTYVTLKGVPNRVFGYLRCHHAIGDGAVLMKVISENYQRVWPNEDNRSFGFAQKIMESGRIADIDTDLEKEGTKKQNRANVLTTLSSKDGPRTAPKEITGVSFWKQLPQLLQAEYDIVNKDPYVPIKTVFRHGEMKREYELSLSPGMNVGKLKILCHHFGCHMQDLMMTLWLTSMSKYLYKRAEKAEISKWKQIYGEEINVGILTVMSGRTSLPKVISVTNIEENDIVMVPLKLPLGEMEFKKRLEIVKNVTTTFKKGSALKVWRETFRACYAQGGVTLVAKTLEKVMSKCVASFSNLKAPVLPLAVGTGGLMWRCFSSLNPIYTPISCTITSYAGVMNVSLSSDIGAMTSEHTKEIVDEIPLEVTRVFNSLPDDNYRWF